MNNEAQHQVDLLKTGALQTAILNSANFSSIATDEHGVIQIFNIGAERMLGYEAADVLNKVTPADISDASEILLRAQALSAEFGTAIAPGFEALVFKASRGIEDIYELTYVCKDGSRLPACVSVTALRDAHNTIIGYLLIGTDNTARKRAEEALIRAGALQSAIFNSANFSSIATDAKGVIQIFNVGAERMLGYAAADVLNKITPADISDPQEVIARAAALSVELGTAIAPGFDALVFKASRGIEDIYELTYIRKDGTRFPAVLSVTALRDEQGDVIGYLLIATDNTARLQASQYARSLLEASLDPLVTISPDGKITDVNEGWIKVTGVARPELIGTDFSDYFTEPAKAREGYQQVFALGSVIDYPLTIRHRDGRLTDVLYNASLYKDSGGTVLGVVAAARDITERKRAEAALHQASALQNAIFNSANFSSIATDAKGVIQIFNVGAERMLGYSAAEVMDKITPAEISDPQEVIARANSLSSELGTAITPGFEALVFKASRGIEDIYELTYIRKDGSRFPAVVSVTALRDDQGEVIGYLLIGTDNTARKQAEDALLRAGALQSAIFNSANFSSIATDAKGVIQIFNVGAERMLGYTADEVMNKITPADISDPQEVIVRAEALSIELGTPIAPGFDALVFKASRGIEDIYELTYIRKDGSRFPAVVSVTALRDAENTIIGYLLIGTDNTARKQAEEALIRAGALQSAIFNSANFSSIATDAKGVIQIFNVGAERMLGYAAADVLNKITPADISDPQEVIARAAALSLELGTTIAPGFEALVFKASRAIEDIYELTYFRKDGSRFPAVVSVTALRDAAEAIIGYLLIGTDNTARKLVEAEQKRLDQALRETNLALQGAKVEAERANLAKSDFLSSMSHELRSPLNAILGFAQLMDSESPPLTAGQKESTLQILQAGWYLLELINEILDLAQIESGKFSLLLEPVSLDEVLADCQAMIEPQMRKSGIRVVFVDAERPLFVNSDRTRLKQVFVNLLSNAIKYNRVGGWVEVSSQSLPGNRLRVSFRDTGAGLSPDKLAQLFQPFNRLGQEAGTEEGTGIGLVVSKQLVEQMGGLIAVESTVGVGSIFSIDLDSADAVQQGRSAPPATAATASGPGTDAPQRMVLYVEDNPANLMLVTKLLTRRPDIKLISAKDGRSGVELAQSAQPDVILMDINLPGISGVAALSMIQADPLTEHIPVIAVSANAMPRDIVKGLEAGFFRYVTKPIKVAEFMETLDEALEVATSRAARAGHTGAN